MRPEAPDRPDVLLVRRIVRPGPARVLHTGGDRHWEAIYTLAGEQPIRLYGIALVMDANTLVVFRNDVGGRDQLEPSEARRARWDALHACFDPGPRWTPPVSLDRLGEHVYRGRATRVVVQQRIRDAFGRLLADANERIASGAVDALASGRPTSKRSESDASRQLMWVTLLEVLILASRGDAGPTLDARVREALEAMARDLAARHTLTSLARSSRLSPSRFAHLFRAELGVAPVRALRLMRLRQAKLQLLYTNDTVERIAEATGFTSSTHLGREFRREFGLSPRAFRRQAGF